jgi:hypothetical protein
MDSYWLLDHEKYDEAIKSLTLPTLTPNFMTKILETFTQAHRHDLVVLYVQTLQEPLDSPSKVELYLSALLRLDVTRALFFTRTAPADLRQGLFEKSLEKATKTSEGAQVVANFPYDEQEEAWARALLTQGPSGDRAPAIEALKLRLTFLGETLEAAKLAQKFGTGAGESSHLLRQSCTPVERKMLDAPQA